MYDAVGSVYRGIWSYASLLESTVDGTEIERALRSRRDAAEGGETGKDGKDGKRRTGSVSLARVWRQKDGDIRSRHNRFHLLRRHSLPDKNATATKSFRRNLTSLAARPERPPRKAASCAPFRRSLSPDRPPLGWRSSTCTRHPSFPNVS